MHDLLEGVIPYELKALLTHFITTAKYFRLEELNDRLSSFEYGYTEMSDRPSIIDIKPDTKLRQFAAQNWLLSTILPSLLEISFLKRVNTGYAFFCYYAYALLLQHGASVQEQSTTLVL